MWNQNFLYEGQNSSYEPLLICVTMLDVSMTIFMEPTVTPTSELVWLKDPASERVRGADKESNCSGARCRIPQSAYNLAAVVPFVSTALNKGRPFVLSANVRKAISPSEVRQGPP